MAPDSSIQRLIARIEEWYAVDLRQRESELEQWLRARSPSADFNGASELAETIKSPYSPLAKALIHGFTVPHTRFFRDSEQFRAIDTALAALSGPKLRIWVAGCSTGEEAYTLALLALARNREVEIVGSDINVHSLAQAQEARYSSAVLEHIPSFVQHHLVHHGAVVELSSQVRRLVRFAEHNLATPPLRPSTGVGWDMILCRNVLIYFRGAVVNSMLHRLSQVLVPGGYLMLGASEFHHRFSKELVPVRIAERIVLQRQLKVAAESMPTPAVVAFSAPSQSVQITALSKDDSVSNSHPLAQRLLSGQLDSVLTESLAMLIQDEEAQPALLLAGIAFHLKGNHQEAITLLEQTQRQHPTCWLATYYLAVSLDALGRYDAARQTYRLLLQSPSPTPAAQALIALLDLQLWKSEAFALARSRLRGSQDRIPTVTPMTQSAATLDVRNEHDQPKI